MKNECEKEIDFKIREDKKVYGTKSTLWHVKHAIFKIDAVQWPLEDIG